MAPYLCEELWELLGEKPFIVNQVFPDVDERWTLSDVRTYPVSINGKKRFTIDLPAGLGEAEIRTALEADERYAKCIQGKAMKASEIGDHCRDTFSGPSILRGPHQGRPR